jgi:O-antigen/teichoic acid export membrane protein
MNLAKKVAYNTVAQIIGKLASSLLGLLAISLMARYLGLNGFGEYTTIITYLSFFAVLTDFGLTLVTTQMINQTGNKDDDQWTNKILSNLMAFRLLSAIIFLGLAPLIVLFLPYSANIKIGIAVTAISFIFIALNQVLVGLFQKKLRMDKVSISEFAGRIILLLGIYLAIRMDGGLIGVLIISVISSAVNFSLNYLFAAKFSIIKLRFDWPIWLELINKSWPLAITIFFNLIYLRADTLLLSLFKPQSEVGLYGAAYKVVDVLITLPFMFAGIILPIITKLYNESNLPKFKDIMQRSADFMIMLAVPIAVGAQFLSNEIMILVAGRDFMGSGSALRILIFASGIIFAGCIFSHAIIAFDQQKKIIKAYVFTAITSLIGYLIFIPLYSFYGAAWVTIYSELSIAVFSFLLVRKTLGFSFKPNILYKSIAASAVMAVFLFASRQLGIFSTSGLWRLIFNLLVSVFVYFITLYLIKGLKKEEIINLLKKNE